MKSKKKRALTTRSRNNPHGANQSVVDPRQAVFLAAYIDPESPTWSNAKQSALKAGYSEEYADNIMSLMPAWLSDNIGDDRRVRMAERHLDEVLAVPILVPAMGAFGPIVKKIPTGRFKIVTKRGKKKKVPIFDEEPVMVYSTSIMREKNKVAEFALSGLKRAKYGKQTGGPGKQIVMPVQININEDREKYA